MNNPEVTGPAVARMVVAVLVIVAIWIGLMVLCNGCILRPGVGAGSVSGDSVEGGPSPGPFGLAWGVTILGVAAGLFALGLFLATHNTLASTVCTGLAVVLAPLGAVLLASKVVSWGALLLAAVAVCLLLILAVTMLIRQWKGIQQIVSGEPPTPATAKLIEKATKANGSQPSPSPSPAPSS